MVTHMSTTNTSHAWSLIEPHWLPLNETWTAGAGEFLSHMKRVPDRIGRMYAGNWCVSEVDNGGFLQFFWNTTGILAPEAAACFEDMGAPGLGAIVQDAMGHFGPIYPRDREKRLVALSGEEVEYPKTSPFGRQDKAFYDWFERNADWEALIESYAQGA
jgi:hypothetical protein